MKYTRLWLLLGVVFILIIPLVFGIIGMGTQRADTGVLIEDSQLASSSMKNVSNITLILNYHDGQNVTFSNITLIGDISPYNATINSIGDENITKYFAINGVFVSGLRINSIWYTNGDQSRNWLYYVDGTFPGISASVLELNNNSIVEWRFVAGNPFNPDTDPDNTFWIYLGVFSGVAAAVAVGLILIAKKGYLQFK
jgi:hypothetical protein